MKKPIKLDTGTKSKVQQSFKEETTITHMLKKFNATGQLPMGNDGNPMYLDHTAIGDYTEMLNQVTEVQQNFNKLPSKIRSRFQNQPKQLLDFLGNEDNRPEAEALGIIRKPDKASEEKGTKEGPKATSTPEDSQMDITEQILEAEKNLAALKEKGEKQG